MKPLSSSHAACELDEGKGLVCRLRIAGRARSEYNGGGVQMRPPTAGEKEQTMPRLYIEATNQVLGEISDAELKVLFENLEEESAEDTDYYITSDTVDYLESRGADARLVLMLRQAIGGSDGVDIRWAR